MAKVYRTHTRESTILSRIESSKEHARRRAINGIRDCQEPLSSAISMKLVEANLVETTNKNWLEQQFGQCLEQLIYADDFDVDFLIAPIRTLVPNPHPISIYVTAYLLEKLLDAKEIVDIYGSDEDLYNVINQEVQRFLPIPG